MPGPWTDEQYARAQELVKSPGLEQSRRQALVQKIRMHESGSALRTVNQGTLPKASSVEFDDGGMLEAFRSQGKIVEPPPNPNKRPPSARPIDDKRKPWVPSMGDVPVVYVEDDSVDEPENDRRYAQMYDEATAKGETVYRARDMGDDWTSKLMRLAGSIAGPSAAAGMGFARGSTAGAVDLESESMGPLSTERAQEISRAHPIASLMGTLGGAILGIPGRITQSVGAAAPAATVGGRIAQGAGQAAKAGLLEGSMEAGGALARGAEPEAVGKRLLIGTGLSGLGGVAAQGVSEGGRALKRTIERGPLGLDLRRLGEETGGKPVDVIGGTKVPKSVDRALETQRATGRRAENVAALEGAEQVRKTVGAELDDFARQGQDADALAADLGEELQALGLPADLRAINPGDAQQTNAVHQALRKYGQPGNEVHDEVLQGIALRNPKLAQALGQIREGEDAALGAVGPAQGALDRSARKVRGQVASERDAYQESAEGQVMKSLEPVYRRVKQIIERDDADGGRMAFESSSALKQQLKKLVRAEVVEATDPAIDDALDTIPIEKAAEWGLEVPEGAGEDLLIILRPAKMNAQQLDRQIRNLDEISKQWAATSTPGTRELGEIGAVARGVRDEFSANEIAPDGYSALKSKHAKLLSELGNKFTALGLPENVRDIDPGDLAQTEAVYKALRRYGEPGNELRDRVVDAIAKENPELATQLGKVSAGKAAPRRGAPEALRSVKGLADEHTSMTQAREGGLKELGNKLTAVGLPRDLKRIDPENLEQTEKVFKAVLEYGNRSNELSDQVLDQIAKQNPALAKALKEKLTMDSYRRLSRGEDVGVSVSTSGVGKYLKPGIMPARLHGAGVNLERGTPRPGPVGALVNPVYGPLEGLLRRPKEQER